MIFLENGIVNQEPFKFILGDFSYKQMSRNVSSKNQTWRTQNSDTEFFEHLR